MRTTLKRGIGRGAAMNGGGNGSANGALGLTQMARYRQPPPPSRTFGRRLANFFFILLVLVLMVAGGAAGGLYLYGKDFSVSIAPHTKATIEAAKRLDYVSPDKPAVALVIGSDHRYVDGKDPGRSDTLMLLRSDPTTHTVSMLSFPRDLRVEIHCPGHPLFADKINAAYSTCGPSGSLQTIKDLTNVPINYLIAVNFIGFIDVVNKLGGVYMDVDRRYFNNHTGPFGYAAINLQPGYQKLNGKQALDFVRYRHTDSDLFRNARQQLFVRAAKEQIARFSKFHIPKILRSIKRNVEVGRSGGKGVDPSTLLNYALFFHGLPGGHFVQVKIQGLEGMFDLTTPQQNIDEAVQEFMNPDVDAPEKANAAALREKYHPKVTGVNPKRVFATVLNGNGVNGSAGLAGTQLRERNYQILQPPDRLTANAPGGWNYPTSKVYYDPRLPNSKPAAKQVAKLFANAPVGVMSPVLRPYANGAMLVVVVGKTYTGALSGSSPVTQLPQHQPAATISSPGSSLSQMRSIRHRVPFRLQYPAMIEKHSTLDPEPPNPRVYSLSGHKAVRLIFRTGVPGQFWGIQETNWSNAPALSEKNFIRHFGKRTFEFFYSGSHLHMVVLKQYGTTYWVVNTLDDALSNETMISIARGLRPLR
jgi:LCP family protein required for cell wall assembly